MPAARSASSCAAGLASLAFVVALGGVARGDDAAPPVEHPRIPTIVVKPTVVDLVLCLDTSGSMEGLINAARTKMWDVVNEIGTSKPSPELRVALLTYGSGGTEEDGYVITQTPLTTDLDLVSEKLFALSTSGGTEYVGRVVKTAIDTLKWGGENAKKLVFVAGNESADQDQRAPFREVMKRAAGLGLHVNSIYCGNADDADAAGWREVAALGAGRYASIDHNHGTVAIATPFDKELAELSGKLNATYVGYGHLAKEASERQSAQDGNAAPSPGAAAARAASKAGGLYDNSGWDLVDKSKDAGFDLGKIANEDLPEAMRSMTLEQKKAYVESKKTEREAIQGKIRELDAKRTAAIRDEMKKQGLDDSKSFDRALREAVREEAGVGGAK